MRHLPKVSVIIPTYNRRHLLSKCIESVLGQTYRNIELVVVNDCSTDGTYEFLEKLRSTYGGVKVVHNRVRRGLPYSRNVGLAVSSGELIFFSEDDLILSMDTIERLVATYLKFSKVIKVGGVTPRVILVSRNRSYLKLNYCNYVVGLMNVLTGEICYNYDVGRDSIILAMFPPATTLIPRTLFNDVGTYYIGYKINYTREESDLYIRALKKGYVFIYQPFAVAYHVSGFGGGCTVKNLIFNALANLHNHTIYLVRHFKSKAFLMLSVLMLKKFLKALRLVNLEKLPNIITFIDELGYRRSLFKYMSENKLL